MADEQNVTTTEGSEEPVVAEVQETPAPDKTAELEDKVRKYEELFLSPEYAEYLRQRAGVQQQPQQQPRRQFTEAERVDFEARLDGLSKAEYAAYIRDAVLDEVKEKLFAPLARDIVQERVQRDIVLTSQKYSDFGNYRNEMIAISNANPALGAEQVYLLAKAQKAGGMPTPSRPAPTKRSGEIPGGTSAKPKEPSGKVTFDTAFNDAFKKAGF